MINSQLIIEITSITIKIHPQQSTFPEEFRYFLLKSAQKRSVAMSINNAMLAYQSHIIWLYKLSRLLSQKCFFTEVQLIFAFFLFYHTYFKDF